MRSVLASTIEEADVTVVDMEAGLEHLTRSGGTLAYADVLLVVMEPSRKSVVTAARTKSLADDLGIPHTFALGNKARSGDDADFFREQCAEFGVPLAGVLPYATAVAEADRRGGVVEQAGSEAVRKEIDTVIEFLDGVMASA